MLISSFTDKAGTTVSTRNSFTTPEAHFGWDLSHCILKKEKTNVKSMFEF